MEIFKDIQGYEGLYRIGNLGTVLNKKNNKLKSIKNSRYLMLSLCKKGVVKRLSIHRLVAINFIPNPENKPCTNHKDGNKLNNNVSNLEWVTHSENSKHSINILGNPKPPNWAKGKFGKNHNRSKKVFEFDLKGNLLAEYESGYDFMRKTGISHTSISWAVKYKRPIFNKYYSRTSYVQIA